MYIFTHRPDAHSDLEWQLRGIPEAHSVRLALRIWAAAVLGAAAGCPEWTGRVESCGIVAGDDLRRARYDVAVQVDALRFWVDDLGLTRNEQRCE